KRFITRFLPTKASATTRLSMSRLWLFSAFETAEYRTLRTSPAMRLRLNSSSLRAFCTGRPRIDWATRFSFCGLIRTLTSLARASVAATRRGFLVWAMDYFLLAFLSAAWPGKFRVGANSPNFMPTISSETDSGTCFWPLWTPNVRPTDCGGTVDRSDQVWITSLRPDD